MAGGGVNAVARAYLVLGLAAAAFALFALSLDPAMFRQLQLQMIKESGPHPPEQGQMDCAATAAEVMEMRFDAVVLLLFAVAQALLAMAGLAAKSRLGTILAMCLSINMAWRLTDVFAGVIHVAIGRCHYLQGVYHEMLVACYAIVGVSSGVLLIAGFLVVLVDA